MYHLLAIISRPVHHPGDRFTPGTSSVASREPRVSEAICFHPKPKFERDLLFHPESAIQFDLVIEITVPHATE
jgi:hypothetical protein